MFLIMAQPKTNCIFRTFRVDESFCTKKQSCKFSKVDIKKWCPFFNFVCFNGRHILKLRYLRSPSTENFFLFQMWLVMLKCFKKVQWQVCSNSYWLRWLPCHMCTFGCKFWQHVVYESMEQNLDWFDVRIS